MRICNTASCFVIDSRGRILLIKHAKLGMWLPPGGHVDESETACYTAIRETREETGLDVKLIQKPPLVWNNTRMRSAAAPFATTLHRADYGDNVHYHYNLCFMARVNGTKRVRPERNEVDDYGWFTTKEILSMAGVPHDVKIIVSERIPETLLSRSRR